MYRRAAASLELSLATKVISPPDPHPTRSITVCKIAVKLGESYWTPSVHEAIALHATAEVKLRSSQSPYEAGVVPVSASSRCKFALQASPPSELYAVKRINADMIVLLFVILTLLNTKKALKALPSSPNFNAKEALSKDVPATQTPSSGIAAG